MGSASCQSPSLVSHPSSIKTYSRGMSGWAEIQDACSRMVFSLIFLPKAYQEHQPDIGGLSEMFWLEVTTERRLKGEKLRKGNLKSWSWVLLQDCQPGIGVGGSCDGMVKL